jgi:hypothetical protein
MTLIHSENNTVNLPDPIDVLEFHFMDIIKIAMVINASILLFL